MKTNPFCVHPDVPLLAVAVNDDPVWLTVAVLVELHDAVRALLLTASLKFQVPAMFKVVGAVELPPQAISTAAIVSAISLSIVFLLSGWAIGGALKVAF